MDQELAAIMRDLVVEFPCCQDVDPMNMNKSQSAGHWFLYHLGWDNNEFNLKDAVTNWSDRDYEVFLNLFGDYREAIRNI